MKKHFFFIIAILMITTSAHAINPIDMVLCKQEVLRCNKKKILVSRITGEVQYAIGKSGKWVPVTGVWKRQLQAMYDVQNGWEKEFSQY